MASTTQAPPRPICWSTPNSDHHLGKISLLSKNVKSYEWCPQQLETAVRNRRDCGTVQRNRESYVYLSDVKKVLSGLDVAKTSQPTFASSNAPAAIPEAKDAIIGALSNTYEYVKESGGTYMPTGCKYTIEGDSVLKAQHGLMAPSKVLVCTRQVLAILSLRSQMVYEGRNPSNRGILTCWKNGNGVKTSLTTD